MQLDLSLNRHSGFEDWNCNAWSPGYNLNLNSSERWGDWVLSVRNIETLKPVTQYHYYQAVRLVLCCENVKTGEKFETGTIHTNANSYSCSFTFWTGVQADPQFKKYEVQIREAYKAEDKRATKEYNKLLRIQRKERNEQEAAELGITVKELIAKRKEEAKERRKKKELKKKAKQFQDQVNLTGEIFGRYKAIKEDFEEILTKIENVINYVQSTELTEEQMKVYVSFLRKENMKSRFVRDAAREFRTTNRKLNRLMQSLEELSEEEEV